MNGSSVTDYYYEKNLQGDIVGIIDSGGNRIVSYKYDSWGRPLTTEGSMAATVGSLNPFRYRGYFYDDETGWYYLKSRYYDPEIGRFINSDSILPGVKNYIQSYNIFGYCQNNPIMLQDSNGTSPQRCGPIKSASWYKGSIGRRMETASGCGYTRPKVNVFKKIKKWFMDNVAYSIATGYEESLSEVPVLYCFKYEMGLGYGIMFDTGKPINIFTTLPVEVKSLLFNEVGVDINIKGYGSSIAVESVATAADSLLAVLSSIFLKY